MGPKLFLPKASQPTTPAGSVNTSRLFLPTPLPSPSVTASPEFSTPPPIVNGPPTPASSWTASPEPSVLSHPRAPTTLPKPIPAIRLPACLACRKKKRKCNHQQPCALCARLNQDCLYDSNPDGTGKRWREMEDAERFMKQFQAGGAMRPLIITENPAAVLPRAGQFLTTSPTHMGVEPDLVEVDAMGQPIREHVALVAAPVLPVVDTTQWPRRKRVKRSYQDPPPPKPILPILPKFERTASSKAPSSQVTCKVLNIHTQPTESTDVVMTDNPNTIPIDIRTQPSEPHVVPFVVDMDGILQDLQNVDPDPFAGFSASEDSQEDGMPAFMAASTTNTTGCQVPPQFTRDAALLQQVTVSTESGALMTQNLLDLDWMNGLDDEFIAGLPNLAPQFPPGIEDTSGKTDGSSVIPDLLDGFFNMTTNSTGNDEVAGGAPKESHVQGGSASADRAITNDSSVPETPDSASKDMWTVEGIDIASTLEGLFG